MKRYLITILAILFLQSCTGDDKGPANDNINGGDSEKEGGISSGGALRLGIDKNSQIYLQELWKNGQPSYLIYNRQEKNLKLNIDAVYLKESGKSQAPNGMMLNAEKSGYREEDDTLHILKKFPKSYALPALSVTEISAKEFYKLTTQKNLPFFTMLKLHFNDGDIISHTIELPRWLGQRNSQSLEKIVLIGELQNGGKRQADVWYEQNEMSVNESEEFEITLKIPANSGTMTYFHKPLVKREKYIAVKDEVAESVIIAASSDKLKIESDDEKIVIDTSDENARPGEILTVNLKFKAPTVEHRSLTSIYGYRDDENPYYLPEDRQPQILEHGLIVENRD